MTELDYNWTSDSPTKQEYPGNEAFAAAVKAHGVALRAIATGEVIFYGCFSGSSWSLAAISSCYLAWGPPRP